MSYLHHTSQIAKIGQQKNKQAYSTLKQSIMVYYFLQKYILRVSSVVKTFSPLEFMVIRQYQISTTITGKLLEK
jgi:hypothetical protein